MAKSTDDCGFFLAQVVRDGFGQTAQIDISFRIALG